MQVQKHLSNVLGSSNFCFSVLIEIEPLSVNHLMIDAVLNSVQFYVEVVPLVCIGGWFR